MLHSNKQTCTLTLKRVQEGARNCLKLQSINYFTCGNVIAQIFMVWWDREFKARVERLGIPLYMYKRYVDDINVIVGAVEPGAKIAGGMLTIDEESKAQDSHRNKDEMCMELLKEVGNGIHKSIQIEVDYPSRHEDNLMPILDLKVWIDRKNVIMNGKDCTVNVVLHEFYAKEVSSKMMLSSRSALPMKVKGGT